MSKIHLIFKVKLRCSRRKESVRICEALPHPVPSQEKKGLCVCGEAPSLHFPDTPRPGAGGARRPALPTPPRAGGRDGRVGRSAGAPGPSRPAGEDAAPTGTRGRGRRPRGPPRDPLGPAGAQPPFVLRLRGRGGLRRHQLSPEPSPQLHARPAHTSSSPRAPPLALPARGLGAPALPALGGRPPLASPGGGWGRWRRRLRRRRPPRDSPRHIPAQPPDR